MTIRALLVAVSAAALVLTAHAPAEAARKPAFRVSIKASAATSDVGTKVVLTGKVRGPKSARKVLLVQRKVGAARWRTIAKTRTTKRSQYRVRVTTTAAGAQRLRVVAPPSRQARVGVSRVRSHTGYRWLDLTTQSVQMAGNTRGPVTVGGVSFPKSFVFSAENPGLHAKTARRCDTLRAAVAVPDGVTEDARVAVFASPNGTMNWEHAVFGAATAGAGAVTRDFSVRDTYMALGLGNGDQVAVINPRVHCSLNALPRFDLTELPN